MIFVGGVATCAIVVVALGGVYMQENNGKRLDTESKGYKQNKAKALERRKQRKRRK